MDTGLAGRTAIVTGATANIGRAIALGLAAEGVRVVAVGRDAEAGSRLVARCEETGGSARFVAADMLDPAAPQRILEAAQGWSAVEILVNNVGGNVGAGFFVESDADTWAGDIDLNFGTVLRMTRAVLPSMVAGRRGAIVNIGSTAGLVGDYMLPVYSAAKAAVHGFTKVLAKEVGQHGVRVNCVAPYGTMAGDAEAFSKGSRFNPDNAFFATKFAGVSAEDMKKRGRQTVLGRPVATPEEVAALAVFLASDLAGFITGQVYPVDGGSLL